MEVSRRIRSRRARVAGLAATLALSAALVAGCSSNNADVSCSGDACTATFQRDANSEVSILGVKVQLVSVQNNQVAIKISGQTVTIPVGQKAEVLDGRFAVEVQKVTQDTVVVRVSRNPG